MLRCPDHRFAPRHFTVILWILICLSPCILDIKPTCSVSTRTAVSDQRPIILPTTRTIINIHGRGKAGQPHGVLCQPSAVFTLVGFFFPRMHVPFTNSQWFSSFLRDPSIFSNTCLLLASTASYSKQLWYFHYLFHEKTPSLVCNPVPIGFNIPSSCTGRDNEPFVNPYLLLQADHDFADYYQRPP